MAHRISAIIPLLFITLLCVGCVEGCYLALEYFLLELPRDKGTEVIQPVAAKPRKQDGTEQKHDYHIILTRNIFGSFPSAAKSVPVVTAAQEQMLDTTKMNIVLMGTISGGAEGSRAIILDKKNKTQELYQKGDAVQDAFVTKILRGKVILSYNGKDEILKMSDTAGSAEKKRPGPVSVAPPSGRKSIKAGRRVVSSVAGGPVERMVQPKKMIPRRRIIGRKNDGVVQ